MAGEVVILPLEAELYAVPTDRVRQVVATPTVTPIPTSPPAVLGVFNLRGEIIPLLDTARLLSLKPTTHGPPRFAVVIETEDGCAALTATTMPRWGRLGPQIGPAETSGTTGLYSLDGELVVLIDPDVLLAPARIESS
jgi:purine-binding chemotaxis protein CheW